jgi:phosphotransacetylase
MFDAIQVGHKLRHRDLILGARVPIVVTSRADRPATRMACCAVSLVFARRGPKY